MTPTDAGLWVRQPWRNPDGTKNAFNNLWPNTLHIGAGIELIPVTSRAPIPRGIDVSLLLDYTHYRHALGVRNTLVEGVSFEGNETDATITRNVLSLLLTLGF